MYSEYNIFLNNNDYKSTVLGNDKPSNPWGPIDMALATLELRNTALKVQWP